MIIKFVKNTPISEIQRIKKWFESMDITPYEIDDTYSVLCLMGDTTKIDVRSIQALDYVAQVKRIQEPYKLVSRSFKQEDTIVDIGDDIKIGSNNFEVMAGPCSIENENQVMTVAKAVKKSGVKILRGGAFKPRTSPYSFQGLGEKAIKLIEIAKQETGLKLVSEIMEISQLKYFDNIDILQVGARNMQNFELLKALGKVNKPILLKRGMSSTYQELLMSAEYILANGNKNVILCERGIRTFENSVRNTLDITAIAYLKEKTHLPVIIDPSHAAGLTKYVPSLSKAAVAAGCDGLIIEVHNDPENALCDGAQCLTPLQFDELHKKIYEIRNVL